MESITLKDRYFKQGKLVTKNPTVSTSRVLHYPIEHSPGGMTRIKNKVSPRHQANPSFSNKTPDQSFSPLKDNK